jgi:hypothetical protein
MERDWLEMTQILEQFLRRTWRHFLGHWGSLHSEKDALGAEDQALAGAQASSADRDGLGLHLQFSGIKIDIVIESNQAHLDPAHGDSPQASLLEGRKAMVELGVFFDLGRSKFDQFYRRESMSAFFCRLLSLVTGLILPK